MTRERGEWALSMACGWGAWYRGVLSPTPSSASSGLRSGARKEKVHHRIFFFRNVISKMIFILKLSNNLIKGFSKSNSVKERAQL